MGFDDTPIKRKLMLVNLLTSGVVLSVTCIAFFAYENHIFQQTTMAKVNSIAQITAANTAAALAVDNAGAAAEMLAALRVEGHIVAAVLYGSAGQTIARYPADLVLKELSVPLKPDAFKYTENHLEGNQPVVMGTKQLGTLYLKSDLKAWDGRIRVYRMVVLSVLVLSLLISWILSLFLSKSISGPIAALSDTAAAVSRHRDYSVRAKKRGNDELGSLTETFNQMLEQIQFQNNTLNGFNKSLEQKVAERTLELDVALQEQKKTESELHEKNRELSRALEELGNTKEMLVGLNNDLEQRVKARTAELEKANEDLDDFLYAASHDLKSPISNVEAFNCCSKRGIQGYCFCHPVTISGHDGNLCHEGKESYSRP
jgi:nitrogen fixation/metabolism regulation signal transduction histidine kinase